MSLSSTEISEFLEQRKASYKRYYEETSNKATYHGKPTKLFFKWYSKIFEELNEFLCTLREKS